jgi:adenylosuccinate synthase
MILQPGKLNVGPIDATHGSSGKSKIADYISTHERLDFAISHNSQNASHITVFDDDTQYKFNFLPSSVAKPGVKVVIGADAVINANKALEEISDWNLNESSIFIHPLVAIIEPVDAAWERENLAHMGSTMTGGGKAKADKITRTKTYFAKDHPKLSQFVVNTHALVNGWLNQGQTGLLETAQGYDLSQDTIWTGLDGKVKVMYPYNTSRNINTSSFLGFSFVPPQLVGNVILNVRSYAIRVGDATTVDGDFVVKMDDESEKGLYFSEFGTSTVPPLEVVRAKYKSVVGVIKLGSSGPVYDDQQELTWDEVTKRSGSPKPITELTSLTKRVRRVFDRSALQIKNSTMVCMPSVISINFANYLDHSISGINGKMGFNELAEKWPKVAEYVRWVEDNQYWAGTKYAGKVMLIGTGAKRSEIIELEPS